MKKKTLPIGYQDFESLREDDCYYVDKTQYILNLIHSGRYYFLSRPRRFGKSLLVSTIEYLFEGRRDLFKGLYIDQKWNWKDDKYPVIHFSFARSKFIQVQSFSQQVLSQIKQMEHKFSITTLDEDADYSARLSNLCEAIYLKESKRVVVLVDEYDLPVIDVLDDTDRAIKNAEELDAFHRTIKDSAKYIRFVFVTGITMISKALTSSGMNYLNDITLHSKYSTICGYTEKELCDVFAPELVGCNLDKIRNKYNGYSWGGESVYNPFGMLNFFDTKKYGSWWSASSKSNSLFNLLKAKNKYLTNIGKIWIDQVDIEDFEISHIKIDPLLFQLGAFTIKDTRGGDGDTRLQYYLDFPSKEVKETFFSALYKFYLGDGNHSTVINYGEDLLKYLRTSQFNEVQSALCRLFALAPHYLGDKSNLFDCEGWYASCLLYSLNGNNCDVRVEDPNPKGRSDFVLVEKNLVFVFELKMIDKVIDKKIDNNKKQSNVDEAIKLAFDQIKSQGYLDKYLGGDHIVHSVAVVMSREKKNVVDVKFQKENFGS